MYKTSSESVKSYLPFPDKLFYKIGDVSKIDKFYGTLDNNYAPSYT